MKKINVKTVVAVLLTVLTILMMVAPVFATSVGGVTIDPSTGKASSSKVATTGRTILGYIQVVGTLIAVGVLMFLGIKYMTASASEKADIKKSIIPYIIGAIILLAAVNILPIIETVGKGLIEGTT